MTLFELELLLTKVTYKPGTKFEVLRPGPEHSEHINEQLERKVIVLIHQNVPDAKKPSRKITVTYVGSIPFIELGYLSAQAVLGKVWYWLQQMELHEMKEWFKVAGESYSEPHPETKKREQAREARKAAMSRLSPEMPMPSRDGLAGKRLEFAILDELEVRDGRI